MDTITTPPLQTLFAWLAAFSVFTFFLSLLLIPLLVARLPRDYFQENKLKDTLALSLSSPKSITIFILRNIIGLLLVALGFAKLFLPGQGVMTIIIGLAIMRFPYKQRLLFKATRSPAIQASLDWLRGKTGKKPFQWN